MPQPIKNLANYKGFLSLLVRSRDVSQPSENNHLLKGEGA
jgi:hypothetical protein